MNVKQLLFLVVLSFFIPMKEIHAQTVFAPENASWNYYYTGHSGGFASDWTVKIELDTIIDGFPTKFLTRTYQVTQSTPSFEPYGTVSEASFGTLQLRNDSVLYYIDYPNDERFLYAFNMSINDTIVIDSINAPNLIAVVDTVYTILHEGFSLKKWELTKYCDGVEFGTAQIVENIGQIDDFILWNKDGCIIGGGWWNFECYQSSSLNYNLPCPQISLGLPEDKINLVQIHPNPTKGLITIESSVNLSNAAIFIVDVAGKIVYTQLPENGFSAQLDISQQSPGIYTVVIASSTLNQRLRVVKLE